MLQHKKNPFFSVVIPAYNRPEYLRVALEGVVVQTFRDFEVLVVDDFSEDDIKGLVNSFNDSRIRYMLNERTVGANGARNTGILNARGEWIKFLDDDDYWLPEMLQLVMQKIDENTRFGAVYTQHAYRNFESGEILRLELPGRDGCIRDEVSHINCVGGFSFLAVNRELALKVGMTDEEFPAAQDWDFNMRLSAVTQYGYVNEICGYYRRDNADNITKSEPKRLRGMLLIYNKHRSRVRSFRKARLRMYYRISKSAFLNREWVTFFRFFPRTAAGLWGSRHNMLKLIRVLAVLEIKKLLEKLTSYKADPIKADQRDSLA